MRGLKILDLSCTGIASLPSSISELKNLNALLLNSCIHLEYMPSLAKLGALKKLDLGGTAIKYIRKGLEMLVHLEYLNLNVVNLKKMPGGLLPKLFRLQVLMVSASLVNVEEMAQLRKLEAVGLRFNTLQDYLWYLSLPQGRSLDKYVFLVGRANYEAADFAYMAIKYYLKRYHIDKFSFNKHVMFGECNILGDSVELPTDVEELFIDRCQNVRSLSGLSSLKNATELKICRIQLCEQFECLVSLSSNCSFLPNVEHLYLVNLPNLIVLFKGERDSLSKLPTPEPPGILSHLRTFFIVCCEKLEKLFFPQLLQSLRNLEVIMVGECSRLVAIVEESEEENKAAGTDSIIYTLPKLRTLLLTSLPELKSICNSHSAFVCNFVEKIVLYDCPKLKRIPLLLPKLDNGQPIPPPCLREVGVHPKEYWNSLEWDDTNTENVLKPFLKFYDRRDVLSFFINVKFVG